MLEWKEEIGGSCAPVLCLGPWSWGPGTGLLESLGKLPQSAEPRGRGGKSTSPEWMAFFVPLQLGEGFLQSGRHWAPGWGWCPVVFGLCAGAGRLTMGIVLPTRCVPGPGLPLTMPSVHGCGELGVRLFCNGAAWRRPGCEEQDHLVPASLEAAVWQASLGTPFLLIPGGFGESVSGVPKPPAVEPWLLPDPEFRLTPADLKLTPTLSSGWQGRQAEGRGLASLALMLSYCFRPRHHSARIPAIAVMGVGGHSAAEECASHSTVSRWQRRDMSSGGLAPEAGALPPRWAPLCHWVESRRWGQRPSLWASLDPMLSLEHWRQQMLEFILDTWISVSTFCFPGPCPCATIHLLTQHDCVPISALGLGVAQG